MYLYSAPQELSNEPGFCHTRTHMITQSWIQVCATLFLVHSGCFCTTRLCPYMEHLSKTFFSETSFQFLKSMMDQVLKVSPSTITWDYKEIVEKVYFDHCSEYFYKQHKFDYDVSVQWLSWQSRILPNRSPCVRIQLKHF